MKAFLSQNKTDYMSSSVALQFLFSIPVSLVLQWYTWDVRICWEREFSFHSESHKAQHYLVLFFFLQWLQRNAFEEKTSVKQEASQDSHFSVR